MAKFFPEEYKFFPQTWLLPAEYGDFSNQFKKAVGKNGKNRRSAKTFISKPEAACQGRGIFLSRNLADFDPQDHAVVQRYTHKVFLIDKLKFDLRIYVLLCGVDPLRIYFFKEGLCRLATCEYRSPTQDNIDNLFMHLTNYAINKASKDFVQNKDDGDGQETGHKRSLTFALEYIREMGHDADKVLHDIKANIIKTIVAVQPSLAHTYKSCQPDDIDNNMCFSSLASMSCWTTS